MDIVVVYIIKLSTYYHIWKFGHCLMSYLNVNYIFFSLFFQTFTPDEIEYALRPVFEAVWNQDPEALPFHKPVEPLALGIPVKLRPVTTPTLYLYFFPQDYFEIIKNPIDLSVIDMKLRQGDYSNPWEVSIN